MKTCLLALFVLLPVFAQDLPPAWAELVITHETFDEAEAAVTDGALSGRSLPGEWSLSDDQLSPHQPRTFSFWWALTEAHPDDGRINWLRLINRQRGYLSYFSKGKGQWKALEEPAGSLQVWNLDGIANTEARTDLTMRETVDLTPGVWHHTAAVITGRSVAVYIDGELWREIQLEGRAIDAEHGMIHLTIGGAAEHFTPMLLDEIIILKQALSADAIDAYFQAVRAQMQLNQPQPAQ